MVHQTHVAKTRDIKGALGELEQQVDALRRESKEWENRAKLAEEELELVKTEIPKRKSVEQDMEAKDVLIGKLRVDGFPY